MIILKIILAAPILGFPDAPADQVIYFDSLPQCEEFRPHLVAEINENARHDVVLSAKCEAVE